MEAETAYGSDNPSVMVGQYLWVTLQAHRDMDHFLHSWLPQHPEFSSHITLYLIGYRVQSAEVLALK